MTSDRRSGMQFAVVLDHRGWLRFLTEEWLNADRTGRIKASIGCVIDCTPDPDLIMVTVWFDWGRLPTLDVACWKGEQWEVMPSNEVCSEGTIISWPGPLPLFAVSHFAVDSPQARAHLLSMARNFADIELPSQPVNVGVYPKVAPPARNPELMTHVAAPNNWDRLRGAASMAIATVPTIGPWLQILCDSLSNNKATAAAQTANAPWLAVALWNGDLKPETASNSPLWRAMCIEFSRDQALKDWSPEQLLHDVCSQARELGEAEELLDRLTDSTMLLLRDRGTIEDLGLIENVVALVLQLILLRPSPGRFVTWKEDWRAIPPGAWWTGAILSGYLSGYRALPPNLRGSSSSRKQIALRTWRLYDQESASNWQDMSVGRMEWAPRSEAASIYTESELLFEHRMSARGQWYDANFDDLVVLSAATELSRALCPTNLCQTISLQAGEYSSASSGKIKFDNKRSLLTISGKLDIPVTEGISISEKLNIVGFRTWLTCASIPFSLTRPPQPEATIKYQEKAPKNRLLKEKDSRSANRNNIAKKSEETTNSPQGLIICENFITEHLEKELIDIIDDHPWNTTMSRRVQHYGWQYDYKARKIDPSSYIGPLPGWASELAERLLLEGFVSELPDQVIINEYLSMQGISKHIDCPSCFRGSVVTISLCETWEMIFARKIKLGSEMKYRVMLPRRSATVLSGESRTLWTHEIAKKGNDDGHHRRRRISITFRKVNISA